MSGSALLSDKLAAARLETQPMNTVFEYGLGIIKVFNEYGHEGEAIGWEGWAGHDPDTGLSVVVFTNSCSDLFGILEAEVTLDPVFLGAYMAASGS